MLTSSKTNFSTKNFSPKLGALFTSLGLTLLASTSLGASWKQFEATNIKRVSIENPAGLITFSRTNKDLISIKTEKIRFHKNCEIAMDHDGELVRVEVKNNDSFQKDGCEVEITAFVPAKTSMNITSGSGDIIGKSLQGEFEFKSGSGDVNLEGSFVRVSGITGSGSISLNQFSGAANVNSGSGDINIDYASRDAAKVRAQTGSGRINANGLREISKLYSGSGDITANYALLPEKGEIEVRTGSGDAKITLPDYAHFVPNLKTGSGSIENEFAGRKRKGVALSLRSGSGDIAIKKQ